MSRTAKHSNPTTREATTTVPRAETLVDILCRRSRERFADPVFTFTDADGDTDLTFGQLGRDADRIAAALRQRIEPRQRVLLLLAPGLDFPRALFGVFRASAIAVPAALPDPRRLQRTLPRLLAILSDARPALIIAAEEAIPSLRKIETGFTERPEIVSIADLLEEGRDAPEVHDRPSPESLAFLQYTSGSTADPKGVMISHRSAVQGAEYLRSAWDYREKESRSLIWVPDFHDDGLMQGNIVPVYGGYRCWRMAPADLVRSPRHWLETISRLRITHSGGPNFAYALAVRRAAKNPQELDLSSWRMAYNAAEPVRADVLDAFARTFAPAGFRPEAACPAFGLAEATLLVTTTPMGRAPKDLAVDAMALESDSRAIVEAGGRRVVSCGPPVEGVDVQIVDRETLEPLPERAVGEVLIGCASLAEGYWMRPEASAETFVTPETLEGRYLRTGDLGYLDDGELYITGRAKDLIIIRGRNLYPQDLEMTAEAAHPAIRPGCVAAVAVENQEGESLALIAEAKKDPAIDHGAVARLVFEALVDEHEVRPHEVVLIEPKTIAKTSSGKIRRQTTRQSLDDGALAVLARFGGASAAAPAPRASGDTSRPIVEIPPASEPASAVPTAATTQVSADDRAAIAADSRAAIAADGRAAGAADGRATIAADNRAAGAADSRAAIAADSRADSASEARAEELLDWMRAWGPRLDFATMDDRRALSPHVLIDLGNRSVFGLESRPADGGLGLSATQTVPIYRQLGSLDLGLNTLVLGQNALGSQLIDKFAADDFREAWLPRLVSGRSLTAFALTEATSGSDPRVMGTTAKRASAEAPWVLRGEKHWIGSAAWAEWILTFARTPEGVSAFLVDRSDRGLRLGSELPTMGVRSIVQCAVGLHDVEVPDDRILGPHGRGMALAEHAFLRGRLGLGAAATGLMRRCAVRAQDFARQRWISTGRLSDHAVIWRRLHDLDSAIVAMDCLVAEVADRLDNDPKRAFDGSLVAKNAGSRLAGRATDDLMQIMGGRGYLESDDVPRYFRDARLLRIYEGTSETLSAHLGSSLECEVASLSSWIGRGPAKDALAAARASLADVEDRLPLEEPQRRQWRRHVLGELVEWAVLWSTTARAGHASGHSIEARQQGADWAEHRLNETLQKALSLADARYWTVPETIANDIDRYADEIGGRDDHADALSRYSTLPGSSATSPLVPAVQPTPEAASEQATEPTAEAASEADSPAPVVNPSTEIANQDSPSKVVGAEEALVAWIRRWMANELGSTYDAIDPETRFSAYGLDSVSGVMLVDELGQYLGQDIDAGALWDHPTPIELAHFAATSPELTETRGEAA